MKFSKYMLIFIGVLIWAICNFFLNENVLDLMFTVITIAFSLLIIFDLLNKNLEYKTPSLTEFLADLIGLSVLVSGKIVNVNYSNIFIYIFILCTLVIIFSKEKQIEN
jgi:hypothetical protein